jgi:hypothetical protein
MMTSNYGRKYITISVAVKLYFAFFRTSSQNIGLARRLDLCGVSKNHHTTGKQGRQVLDERKTVLLFEIFRVI